MIFVDRSRRPPSNVRLNRSYSYLSYMNFYTSTLKMKMQHIIAAAVTESTAKH